MENKNKFRIFEASERENKGQINPLLESELNKKCKNCLELQEKNKQKNLRELKIWQSAPQRHDDQSFFDLEERKKVENLEKIVKNFNETKTENTEEIIKLNFSSNKEKDFTEKNEFNFLKMTLYNIYILTRKKYSILYFLKSKKETNTNKYIENYSYYNKFSCISTNQVRSLFINLIIKIIIKVLSSTYLWKSLFLKGITNIIKNKNFWKFLRQGMSAIFIIIYSIRKY